VPFVRAVLVMRVVKEHNAAAGEWHQMAAVCLFEHLSVKDELRCPMNNYAPRKGDHVMEALGGTGEIVRGGDDGATTSRLCIQDVHDPLLRHRVNPCDWFVEQVDLWIGGKGTRNEDAAPLPTREFADLSRRKV
jgi:hypothetical protein